MDGVNHKKNDKERSRSKPVILAQYNKMQYNKIFTAREKCTLLSSSSIINTIIHVDSRNN